MKKALGRGLDELIQGGLASTEVHDGAAVTVIPSVSASPSAATVSAPVSPLRPAGTLVQQIALDRIEPNRLQPRMTFDETSLRELADSIRQRGVMQPVLVRPLDGVAGRYELIAGERRWRAAREAGLTMVPALVRIVSDEEALELALIENLQREDLNPIEEARAYRQLTTQFRLTQEQVAEKVGRSRAAVANAMRLLELPEEVQSWVANGQLSVGHAKAILGLSIAEEQRLVAQRVLREGLTVRETERLVEQLKGQTSRPGRLGAVTVADPHVKAIEERLRDRLSTAVRVRHTKAGKGRIVIEYYNNEDLARLLSLLGVDNL
ncbi:MAG: ParB/RepB/Spo0J family partition protein [Verrucomicrobiae bacterium]|nr:ParB/RepB/Spo0J family partition protein [Verrucomicrobiae bacterium]